MTLPPPDPQLVVDAILDAGHPVVTAATESDVEREVRDALGGLVYSGTSDDRKNLIAALLGVATGQP